MANKSLVFLALVATVLSAPLPVVQRLNQDAGTPKCHDVLDDLQAFQCDADRQYTINLLHYSDDGKHWTYQLTALNADRPSKIFFQVPACASSGLDCQSGSVVLSTTWGDSTYGRFSTSVNGVISYFMTFSVPESWTTAGSSGNFTISYPVGMGMGTLSFGVECSTPACVAKRTFGSGGKSNGGGYGGGYGGKGGDNGGNNGGYGGKSDEDCEDDNNGGNNGGYGGKNNGGKDNDGGYGGKNNGGKDNDGGYGGKNNGGKDNDGGYGGKNNGGKDEDCEDDNNNGGGGYGGKGHDNDDDDDDHHGGYGGKGHDNDDDDDDHHGGYGGKGHDNDDDDDDDDHHGGYGGKGHDNDDDDDDDHHGGYGGKGHDGKDEDCDDDDDNSSAASSSSSSGSAGGSDNGSDLGSNVDDDDECDCVFQQMVFIQVVGASCEVGVGECVNPRNPSPTGPIGIDGSNPEGSYSYF